MQIDNIRTDPWIPAVRRTTLMLMLACFGIGILIGSLTAEKIVVTQDRLITAAAPVDPAALPTAAKEGGGASREQRTVRAELARLADRRVKASQDALRPFAAASQRTTAFYSVFISVNHALDAAIGN